MILINYHGTIYLWVKQLTQQAKVKFLSCDLVTDLHKYNSDASYHLHFSFSCNFKKIAKMSEINVWYLQYAMKKTKQWDRQLELFFHSRWLDKQFFF